MWMMSLHLHINRKSDDMICSDEYCHWLFLHLLMIILLATISSASKVLPSGPASPIVVVALPHFPSGVSPFPLKTKFR